MGIKNIFKNLKYCRNNKKDINIDEIMYVISTNPNSILLDVRSPQEFKEGHLNGAINIPLYELESCCTCKLKEKDVIIIVYCQSGIRSKKAIKILNKNGFKNIYHLKNGLDGI